LVDIMETGITETEGAWAEVGEIAGNGTRMGGLSMVTLVPGICGPPMAGAVRVSTVHTVRRPS